MLCDPHLMQPEIMQAQQQAYARKSQRMPNHSPRSQQRGYFQGRPGSPNSPNQHFTPFVQPVQVPMMPVPQSSAFNVPTTYFHYGSPLAAYNHHPSGQFQWRPVQHAIWICTQKGPIIVSFCFISSSFFQKKIKCPFRLYLSGIYFLKGPFFFLFFLSLEFLYFFPNLCPSLHKKIKEKPFFHK